MRLEREFYIKDGLTLARDLLGKILVVSWEGRDLKGRILETEAYLGPEDRASHAWNNRRTPRTEAMYKTGGYAYVFTIYGIYNCFNVVAYIEGIPHAVLIRAIEPLEGEEIMRERRGGGINRRSITNGPGKLSLALGITRGDDGRDLVTDKHIWIEEGDLPERIVKDRRIGIDYAGEYRDRMWRYYIEGNPWVSKKRKEVL